MTSVFVVTQCYRDYEGGWASPILATPDSAKAEAKKAEMEARLVVCNKERGAVQAHMRIWEAANPRPGYTNYRDKPLPIFKGKKKTWTEEQRAGYKAVEEENQAGRAAAIQPLRDWSMTRMVEEKRYTGTLPTQVQEDLNNFDTDQFWEIEEVPYEE